MNPGRAYRTLPRLLSAVVLVLMMAPAACGGAGEFVPPGTVPPFPLMDRTHPYMFVERLFNAPFPYEGPNPETGLPFFDRVDPATGKRLHTNRYGQTFEEQRHYTDGGVLFCLPPGFNPEKPFEYLVFFHGNETHLEKALAEHDLVEQVAASGRNVILIAPQLAKDAADSSPGKFFQPGAFRAFMDEAAHVLSRRLEGVSLKHLQAAPIHLAAFSGGYKGVAYVLERGWMGGRVRGILLLDALYENLDKFEAWQRRHGRTSFLVLIHTEGSVRKNAEELGAKLKKQGFRPTSAWPAKLEPGRVHFIPSAHAHPLVPVLGPPERPIERFLRSLPEEK